MKKPIGIKIIKRQDTAKTSAVTVPNVVNREAAFGKKTGRELAERVTDWVREWRERRRIEGKRNIRRFFGEPDAMPTAA